VYYLTSLVGVALAKSGKVSPFLGVWSANIVFTIVGVLLLQQLSRGGIALNVFSSIGQWMYGVYARWTKPQADSSRNVPAMSTEQTLARVRSTLHIRFPLLLDDYVMREFLGNFFLVLSSFAILFLIFTFFELIGDIIRNRTALVTVGDYLINLVPYIIYAVTPLCEAPVSRTSLKGPLPLIITGAHMRPIWSRRVGATKRGSRPSTMISVSSSIGSTFGALCGDTAGAVALPHWGIAAAQHNSHATHPKLRFDVFISHPP